MTVLPIADLADVLNPEASAWIDDPVGWVETVLGEHLWSKQREILESVRDHRRTAVHSGFGIGKSWTAAHAVAWWVGCGVPFVTQAVTTAPTDEQVKGVLWAEIRRVHENAKLRGRTNLKEWWLGEQRVAFGRSPSDTRPEAFQGHHAEHLLVVVDEAAGVAPAILDTVEGLVTTEHSRILAIGNPDAAGSPFAKMCEPGSGWNVIHVDVLESPNFTGEEVHDAVRRNMPNEVYVDEKRKTWGESSPIWTAKVRGIFPEDADDGVVRASKVVKCRVARDTGAPEPVELGVDVGAGGDFSAICQRRGMKAGPIWRDHSRDSEKLVGVIVQKIKETGATRVKVDTIGVGWGVIGHLRSLRHDHRAEIVPVNVGESARDKRKFPRLRDQLWWEVGRELSEDQAWDLSDLDDDTIVQLLAPKYTIDTSGRVKVEPKDDTRDRIGRSPDDADALLLCFYARGISGVGGGWAEEAPVARG